MYKIKYNPEVIAILDSMRDNDPKSYQNIKKKIIQIANMLELNPDHCKNLKKPLQKYKRVHVNTHFVLIFFVDIQKNEMIVVDYDHHKKIYQKKNLIERKIF